MRGRSDAEFVAAFALGAALGAGVAFLLGREETEPRRLRASPGTRERGRSNRTTDQDATTAPARSASSFHSALEAVRAEVGEFVQVVAHELAHSVLRRLHGSRESTRPGGRARS